MEEGAKMAEKKIVTVPKEMQGRYNEISNLIIVFCDEKLNEEYRNVCCQLCAALCRKRPSPLLAGKANTWACGIIHAIGMVNFLFDSKQKPHIKASEIYSWFGIAESTGSGKSKQIRDLMKMNYFDTKWTLPSKMENNPLVWMIQVNGLVVDARYCPREIQEEAYKKGLIPYMPY